MVDNTSTLNRAILLSTHDSTHNSTHDYSHDSTHDYSMQVSYGDMAQPRSVRRERLLGQYGFWCACPRCETKTKTE